MPGIATEDLTIEAALALADSLHVDEQYTEAMDAYTAALSVLSRNDDSALRLRILSHRSSAFFQLGRYQEALEDAQAALKALSEERPTSLRPGEGEVCHKRAGLASFRLEDYIAATEALQQAAQLAKLNHRPDEQYSEWIRQCDEKLNPSRKKAALTTSVDAAPVLKPSSTHVAAAPVKQVSPTNVVASSSRPATSTSSSSRPAVPKYQYYQTDKIMTISIVEANVQEENLIVNFEPRKLTVQIHKGGVDLTVIAGILYSDIDVDRSKVVIKAEKVLIKLRKVEAHEWHELFGKASDAASKELTTTSKGSAPKSKARARPYASHKDWDAIEKNVIEDEKKEKPEGDEAMNKLFKQIYANSSDETRRAMIKSYQTSGGTVLSTNWDEVSKKDYENERSAPDGMEWKNWEGKKLPTKDDDDDRM